MREARMRGGMLVALAVVVGCSRFGGVVEGDPGDGGPTPPQLVLKTSGAVNAIAVQDGHVYLGKAACIADPARPGASKPTGAIASVSIDGGDELELWNGPEMVMTLAVWNGGVFALTEGECMVGHELDLHRVPVTGGADERIAGAGGGLACSSLYPASDALYWLIPGTIHRYTAAGDAVIASGYTCNGEMAVRDGQLTFAAAGSLWRVDAAGGPIWQLWPGGEGE